MEAYRKQRVRLLRNLIAKDVIPKGGIALDIGCFDGETTRVIADSADSVIGIDIQREALEIASKKCPNATFRDMNCEEGLDFDDEKFDYIFAGEVIEHIYNIPRFLSEINRVLKYNGLFICSTPYHGVVKNLLIALFNFESHFSPLRDHIRFFTSNTLKRCLESFGFRCENIRRYGRIWPISVSMLVISRKIDRPSPNVRTSILPNMAIRSLRA